MDTNKTLFRPGPFTSHSGLVLPYKIECDSFSVDDLAIIANAITKLLPEFSSVAGIATGGLRLATELENYISNRVTRHLIVDDVLTTGKSMEQARNEYTQLGRSEIIGAVIFARGYYPPWITALFSETQQEVPF